MNVFQAMGEFFRDYVFGNGYIAVALFIVVALVVLLARVTKGGQL